MILLLYFFTVFCNTAKKALTEFCLSKIHWLRVLDHFFLNYSKKPNTYRYVKHILLVGRNIHNIAPRDNDWLVVRVRVCTCIRDSCDHCFNPPSWLSNTEQACSKIFYALPVCMLAIETGGCGIYISEKSGKIFSHRFIQQSKQRLWACWAQINILFLCPRHFSPAWINTRYRLLW